MQYRNKCVFGAIGVLLIVTVGCGNGPTLDQPAHALGTVGDAVVKYLKEHKGTYPPAYISSSDGKPLLSWRVAILPFLGEQELYKQFKLNEAWDSEHNRALVPKMPLAYRLSPHLPAGKTSLLAVRVAQSGWKESHSALGASPSVLMPAIEGRRLGSLINGTTGAVVAVVATDSLGIEWTKPADFDVTPDTAEGINSRLSAQEGNYLILYADGSVIGIPAATPAGRLVNAFMGDANNTAGDLWRAARKSKNYWPNKLWDN